MSLPDYPLADLKLTKRMRVYYGDQLWYGRVLELEGKIGLSVETYAKRHGVTKSVARAHYNDQVAQADEKLAAAVQAAESGWGQ